MKEYGIRIWGNLVLKKRVKTVASESKFYQSANQPKTAGRKKVKFVHNIAQTVTFRVLI